MLSTGLLGLVLGVAGGALPGCPDPEGRFNEYEQRIPDGRVAVEYDAAEVNDIPDISGTAVLALRIAFAQVNIQTRVDWTLTKAGQTGSLDMTIRYLRVPTDMTTGAGREPVGDPVIVNDVAVDNTASFTIVIPILAIPAEANPLGNAATATDVMLSGTIRSPDLTCGAVSGMVTVPISQALTGSTFASIRATPGATGAALPAAVVSCPP